MNKKVDTKELYLLKTDKGYLEYVSEEDQRYGEYPFTENPFGAFNFETDWKGEVQIPRYLGDYTVRTVEDACEYLNGKMVKIKVTITTETEEIE